MARSTQWPKGDDAQGGGGKILPGVYRDGESVSKVNRSQRMLICVVAWNKSLLVHEGFSARWFYHAHATIPTYLSLSL